MRLMTASPELICDLKLIKAEYRWIEHRETQPCYGFRIKLQPSGHGTGQIDVDEEYAEQFAAEMEAVAALIRAKLIRGRSPSPS
jgi:hypothetical protein